MGRTAVVLRLASSGRKAWVHPLSFVGRALSTSTTESSSSSDIVFPWRSSAVELQRLVEQDDLSGQSNSLRARFFRGALAGREMGLSWFQVLLWPTWQQELADDLVWAFQKGLAGLLSKTFRGKFLLSTISMRYTKRFETHCVDVCTCAVCFRICSSHGDC